MTLDDIHISAVAYQADGQWLVQGIEYDILTRAKDPSDVPLAFMRAVVANVCISEQLGRRPLEGIKPAPERFKAMFDAALTSVRSVQPGKQAADLDIRLVAAPA